MLDASRSHVLDPSMLGAIAVAAHDLDRRQWRLVDRRSGHASITTIPGAIESLASAGVVPDRSCGAPSPATDCWGLLVPHRHGAVGVVVGRSGPVRFCSVDDGRARPVSAPPAGYGVLGDLVLRRVGRPTPPPVTSTGWYWAMTWLDELRAAAGALDPGSMLGVAECARRHPAVLAGEVRHPLDLAELTAFLVDRHREHARLVDWESVRLSVERGDAEDAVCTAAVAAFLDEGSFSRAVGAGAPPIDRFVPVLLRSVSDDARELVGAVVSDLVVRHRAAGRTRDPHGHRPPRRR